MKVLVIHNQGLHNKNLARGLERVNFPFVTATGFKNGYDLLTRNADDIHAIIVNYAPLSDATGFLKKLTKDDKFRDIPLILCLDREEQGKINPPGHTASCQWLQNPFTDHALYSVVQSAENDFLQRRVLRREIQSRQSVIGAITRGTFRIQNFEQAEALATMLAMTCPEPDRIAFGLFEILANGIEHGNLEIGNEEKWRLMANNIYRDEINMRLTMPEYKDRYVEITFERESDLMSFKIEDQGAGFNYRDYLDIDLSANQTCHGRGIALARATSFDYLEFMGNGNKLLAITKFTAHKV